MTPAQPGIEVLQPDPHNANKGTARGRALLEKSLRQYGAGRSIVSDKHDVTICGNKTLEAAADIGLPIRIVETDGTELVVVKRTDLDLATDKAARELAYADNRVAEVDLEWDAEQLAEDRAAGIDLEGFWHAHELDALIEGLPTLDTDGLDRVAPDEETARPGLYLHLGDYKIPVSPEEYDRFTARLDAYREEVGTFYGFVGRLLGEE
jgi:hypothetical protein